MKKIFVLAAIIFSSQLFAQTDSTNVLDEVVISASKYPKKQSQTGKVITVINQQVIQQMGGRSISEVLNTVAGTNINGANNNLGTNQGVSIRGSSFGNVLILVDGIPVNDPSLISNYFDLNFINLDQVERIEVLKGGQSTLYGSDAVAGVINIITKNAGIKPVNIQSSFMGGSYGTWQTTAGMDGKIKKLNYKLSHNQVHSNGFSSAYDSTGSQNFDKDGYDQQIIRAELGFKTTEKLAIKWLGNYSTYDAAIDASAFRDEKDYTINNHNLQTGIGIIWRQQKGQLQANYLFNQIKRNYLNDSLYKSDPDFYYLDDYYTGKTHFAEVYQRFTLNKIEWLVGADLRYNKSNQQSFYVFKDFFTGQPVSGESSLADSIANSWQMSPYTSLVYTNNQWNIELGGRWNYHNEYGNNFTYTLNPSFLLQNKIKLFANISSAFKTPTHYQLFDAYSGNPLLQPEKSITFESGVDVYLNEQVHFRTTYFNSQIKNVIHYIIVDPSTFMAKYMNVNRQHNRGLEAEMFFKNDHWSLNANYTFTKASIRTSYAESGNALGNETTYKNLYRVPAHAANMFASYALDSKLTVSTLLRWMDHRYEPIYLSEPVKLDAYFTADISASFQASKKFRFFVDLKNITNTRYFDIYGYNNRRFNFNVGCSFNL